MNIENLSFISQSVCTAILNLLFFIFYKNAYGAKKYHFVVFIAAYIISTFLMIIVNLLNILPLNAVYSYVSFNVICMLFFNSKFKNVWIYNSLYWFLFACTDAITVLIWSVISGTSLEGIVSDYQLMICSNLFNILLMLAVYKIFITIIKKIEIHTIQWKLALFMVTMIFFEVFIIVSFATEISNQKGGIKIIVLLIGLIVINIFLSYVIGQVSEAYKYKYELSLAEHLREMQFSNYKEIEQKYRESRAIIHDIKKHMMVVDDLKSEKSTEYSQNIYKRLDELFCGFRCSSQILSVVMSQKISYAKTEDINILLNVDEIPLDFIDDFDITAIFANLWDNAIEACKKLDNGKYINMRMGKTNNYLFISMENSCDGNLLPNGKYFLSTKENHKGIGLSSIKMSVEKYNGFFSTELYGSIFKADITIPIKQK